MPPGYIGLATCRNVITYDIHTLVYANTHDWRRGRFESHSRLRFISLVEGFRSNGATSVSFIAAYEALASMVHFVCLLLLARVGLLCCKYVRREFVRAVWAALVQQCTGVKTD